MTIHEVPAPAPPAAQREAPPISLLTVALLDLLRGIGRGPGLIHITAQKRAALTFQPPFSLVPRPLLEWLRDPSWSLHFTPVLRADVGMDRLVTYAAAFAVWRPALAFSRETDWQYVVPEADQCAIADLLGAVPPGTFPLAPSYIIDGTSELAALWLLDEPLSLHAPADRARAEALQVQLSARLSADASAGALDAMLPLPGSAVRDVGQANTPPVVLLTCAPGRHYTLMQLEEATR